MSSVDEQAGRQVSIASKRADLSKAAHERSAEWAKALPAGRLPDFVKARLEDAGAGRTPWISTMTPAELLLSRTHGVRPIATVSGTCWHQTACIAIYTVPIGNDPIAVGWRAALDRIRDEAIGCGANAVVDVKLRSSPKLERGSMEFSLVGTAVRVGNLPRSHDPVVATVSALEFVRLLEAGIVPVGVAIGARFSFINDASQAPLSANSQTRPLPGVSKAWEAVRRAAYADLKRDAGRQGAGVLAHTQREDFVRESKGDNRSPASYFGRFVAIGTVVDTPANAPVPHGVQLVVDMQEESPLGADSTFGAMATGDLGFNGKA